MKFAEALGRIDFNHTVLSFTGAGGKSTSIYRLAGELSSDGYNVLVTTTTMIYHPDVKKRPYNRIYIGNIEKLRKNAYFTAGGSITVAAEKTTEHAGEYKLKGFLPEEINMIYEERIFDCILVEADGAKHLPIKAPGRNEPVIPSSTGITIGVIGLEAAGSVVSPSTVFRIDEFKKITGIKEGDSIGNRTITRLVLSDFGLFKNSPAASDKFVILNKADDEYLIKKGTDLAEYILINTKSISGILVTAMETENPVRTIRKKQYGEK